MIEDSMAVGLAGMASTGSPRQPMDREALRTLVNASAQYTSGGMSVGKNYSPAGDPGLFPTASSSNVMQTGRGGARYGLRVQVPAPVFHEAGPTQANGRLVRGKGTSGSFAGGAAY